MSIEGLLQHIGSDAHNGSSDTVTARNILASPYLLNIVRGDPLLSSWYSYHSKLHRAGSKPIPNHTHIGKVK